ncbi:hypothetical protein EIP86_002217 [Pleurotus ostreatoroseus]|nr:hypothetical protein EIP86_002217 [Pleurotus ostreatoroseus]
MHTPLRLAPYTLKKLNLWSDNPSAEVVTLDEIDDIYVAPSPYPSWSSSLSDETITSSDEDTSDGDSMFSLVPEDSTFGYSTSLVTSDAEDVYPCSSALDQDGLVVTTMEPLDLFDDEVRVSIPRPKVHAISQAYPTTSTITQDCVVGPDVQTVSDSHLFDASPDICVRLPRSYIPDVSHVSINDDETPRISSNGSYYWGVQYSNRPQDFATFDTPVAPLESQETRPNQTLETQDTVERTSQYTSVPLQHLNATLPIEHGFSAPPLSEFPLDYGHSYSELPSSASYWTSGSDSGYSVLHDLHNAPYTTHISIYDAPLADATSFQQAPPTQSQATSLLAILNAFVAQLIDDPASSKSNLLFYYLLSADQSCVCDQSALKRCALVSRAMLEASQYHLFRSLRVSEDRYSHNFAAFGKFLQNDASPRFCAQVRNLVIRGDQGSYDFPTRALLDRPFLTLILTKLALLSSFTISDVRLQEARSPVYRRFKLDKLTMTSVGSSRDSPRTILSFLDSFSGIRVFHANFVDSWYEPAPSQGLVKPLGQSLDALCLETQCLHLRGWTTVNCILDILKRSSSVRTLRSINVECSDAREVASVGELIRAVGNNMTHVTVDLSIVFREQQDPRQLAASLRLASATSLESLRISILPNIALPIATAMVHMARASECLCQILNALSPTTRRVVLELSPTDVVHDRFMLIDWEGLASVDWRRFTEFERFTIMLKRGASAGVADEIRRKLYVVAEKGILDIRGD